MAPSPFRWSPSRRVRRSLAAVGSLAVLLVVATFVVTGCVASFGRRPDPTRMASLSKTSKFVDGHFDNYEPKENFGPNASVMKEMFFGKNQTTPPGPLPVVSPLETWQTPPVQGLRVTWLGHSTTLVEIDGARVLTDPVWSDRASPFQWAGPKRFISPLVKLEELPPLDAVVISHDHYDHLDTATIQTLAKSGVPFFVPLGVRSHLEHWGVPSDRITELDWWQEAKLKDGKLTLVSTPARHFSGRSLSDRNCTLWTSWVIRTEQHRVYFSGDTGLTPQFEDIGKRQGPFDVVMLEVGAFHPSWADIHLGPDNAVRAFEMLGGGTLLPIHWGTFNLAIHDWNEPGEKLRENMTAKGLTLVTPRLGGAFEPGRPVEHTGATVTPDAWWHEVKPSGESKLSKVPEKL